MNYKSSNKNKQAAEAAAWFTKTMSGDVTSETGWKFRAWLAESPENRAKFELLGAIWDHSEVLKDSPVAIQDLNELRENRNRSKRKRRFHGLPGFMPTFRAAALAAAVVLVFVSLWVFQPDGPTQNIYATKTGELRTIFLPDGSTVHLDTETKLSTHLSKDIRRIELIMGRALFTVFHDPKRPFIVDTGSVSIRALGTEFKVYKEKNGRVTVAVATGKVQIIRKQRSEERNRETAWFKPAGETVPKQDIRIAKLETPSVPVQNVITTGQEMIIEEQKAEVEIKSVDVKKIHSWRNGQLYFNMAPLPEVIKEINRYLDTKILIGDDRLKEMQVSLNFNIEHRKHFLSTLKETLPIRSRIDSSGRAVIVSADL